MSHVICSVQSKVIVFGNGVFLFLFWLAFTPGRYHFIAVLMMKIKGELALLGAIISVFVVAQSQAAESTVDEDAGREYIEKLNELKAKDTNRGATASWNYQTNMTTYNQEQMVKISLEIAQNEKKRWEETTSYPWEEYEDEDLKRMFQKYSQLGTAALPEESYEKLINAINNMQSNYAKATVCDYNNRTKCDLHIEPEVTDAFATSNNPDELKYYWAAWHDAAGAPSRGNFTEYVKIKNEAAKLNGYDSVAEWWLGDYEEENEDQFVALWAQLKPLYQQVHAYVRRQLRLEYGEDVVSTTGPIPAHLLRNVWAQDWVNVEEFTRPYPNKTAVDVTAAMVAQNYTPLKMFKIAEEFFTSLGLKRMTDTFWEKSIIEKPDDGREIVCHPSAWNFFDGEDFRIRQCTTVTDPFLTSTHHEMGHIEYYMHYQNQPVVYREGANPGFHEAIGDTMALSVSTPKHLRQLGLLEEGPDDLESNINQLYKMSLEKVVYLPFSIILDLYRYGVFRGTTTSDDYNCHFWKMREAIQGVEPPLSRTEADFDPAAKYHISDDDEYMRYFVAIIYQFQFQYALCIIAGEYTPGNSSRLLSNCDIYKSTEAGTALGKMLQLGSSKPWPDAMEALTGQRIMDATGLLDYFQPLYEWLQADNEANNELIGWEDSTVQFCTSEQIAAMETSGFNERLKKYANL